MTRSGTWRPGFREAVAIALALVVFRSTVWVFVEAAHFDSDQAITGLMAKHLAEARAFPLYFYGQHYMLGVESWLAAPLFLVTAPSVTALKLPLLAVNLIVAWLLVWILVRREGLPPSHALAIALFFVAPPLTVSSMLVEAQGGNIEPFLYVLLIWLLRDRPIAAGLVAGFAIEHREFTVYAIVALFLVEVVSRRAFRPSRIRDYLVAFGAMNVVWSVIGALKLHADLSGPGTAGGIAGSQSQLATLGSFLCWNPSELGANLHWLVTENLGFIFGWTARPHVFGHHTIVTGGVRMAVLFVSALAAGVVVVVQKREQVVRSDRWMLPCYLVLVAIQAALVYAVLGCAVRGWPLARYTLLTMFLPIGVFTLALSVDPGVRWRRVILSLIAIWALFTVTDHTRYLSACIRHPLARPYRDLANLLEAEGVKYAWAPYWTAYELDFLTRERVTVASSDVVRIVEYQRILQEHDRESVQISEESPCPRESLTFGRWCLGHLDRARAIRQPAREAPRISPAPAAPFPRRR